MVHGNVANHTNALLDWMERQYQISAEAMLHTISARDLLASIEMASYDPDPDYFFHWLRDSALFMVLRGLTADRRWETLGYFVDFVQFNLALCRLDGRALLRHEDF